MELTKAPDVHISKNALSATVDIEIKSDGQQSLRMVSTYTDAVFNTAAHSVLVSTLHQSLSASSL